MRLSLDALAVLDAVERHGSFAGAAQELHRVPSAITYTMQKLESDLGVEIFDRSGHRAQLTRIGHALLAEGRHLLQTANAVEARVRRLASGWEPELVIACSDLIEPTRLYPLLARFYQTGAPTRLRLTTEVLGGSWDALFSGRADIALGDSPLGPLGPDFRSRHLTRLPFLFAVSPDHPLADRDTPLSEAELLRHRIVAVADSSRSLPPRSAGILPGQDVLTVSSMSAKIDAQIAGLGVGYLPEHLARPHLDAGRLRTCPVAPEPAAADLTLAWRAREAGQALTWFLKELGECRLP